MIISLEQHSYSEEANMETLIVALVLAGVMFAVYNRGKQTGSHGGYQAGRRRGRREAFRRPRRKGRSTHRERPDRNSG